MYLWNMTVLLSPLNESRLDIKPILASLIDFEGDSMLNGADWLEQSDLDFD